MYKRAYICILNRRKYLESKNLATALTTGTEFYGLGLVNKMKTNWWRARETQPSVSAFASC